MLCLWVALPWWLARASSMAMAIILSAGRLALTPTEQELAHAQGQAWAIEQAIEEGTKRVSFEF